MDFLLRVARAIDTLNARVGKLAEWSVLLACLISAGNALSRYAFDQSSNAWLELQWYLFAAMVLLGAAYTLQRNEHVRVDLLYGRSSPHTQAWIDIFGGVFFLLPMAALLAWMSWPMFSDAWRLGEMSGNAGGLIRWPVKLMLPVGFALLLLQGLSELIKRVAYLRGYPELVAHYERPMQ